MRAAAIKVNAGWGDKAWALAGATGVAGLVMGWMMGAAQVAPPAAARAGQATLKPDRAADARWVGLFTASAEQADERGLSAGCEQLRAAHTPPATPHIPAVTALDADAAERNAVLNDILARPGAAPLSDADLQRQGPAALLARMTDTQADADTRLEAASAMQAYFDAPLPAPVVRQVLDMASAQPDPVLQQDALDLLQGRMQPELVSAVSAFLQSPDEATREMAIHRLSELPQDSQALSALAQVASQDASDVLRYLAARRRE